MAIGLDPNSRSVFGSGDMNTPIIEALYSLSLHMGTHEAQVIIDSLAMLIRKGADIYDVHWADNAWYDAVEDGVMTPTAYARAMDDDLVALWETALRRAGLNPLEVFAEDARRRREFLKTQGALIYSIDLDDGLDSGDMRLRRTHILEARTT